MCHVVLRSEIVRRIRCQYQVVSPVLEKAPNGQAGMVIPSLDSAMPGCGKRSTVRSQRRGGCDYHKAAAPPLLIAVAPDVVALRAQVTAVLAGTDFDGHGAAGLRADDARVHSG